jgi:hypothetical protein
LLAFNGRGKPVAPEKEKLVWDGKSEKYRRVAMDQEDLRLGELTAAPADR